MNPGSSLNNFQHLEEFQPMKKQDSFSPTLWFIWSPVFSIWNIVGLKNYLIGLRKYKNNFYRNEYDKRVDNILQDKKTRNLWGWTKQWMKYFTFMHLIVRSNALLLERKERKNQSILKVDFSNAINKINSENRRESYSRGEDIT